MVSQILYPKLFDSHIKSTYPFDYNHSSIMMISNPTQELQLQSSQAKAGVKKQFWFFGQYNTRSVKGQCESKSSCEVQVFYLKILSSMKCHLSNFFRKNWRVFKNENLKIGNRRSAKNRKSKIGNRKSDKIFKSVGQPHCFARGQNVTI